MDYKKVYDALISRTEAALYNFLCWDSKPKEFQSKDILDEYKTKYQTLVLVLSQALPKDEYDKVIKEIWERVKNYIAKEKENS